MWLLSTSRAELQYFQEFTQVRYAILSHVWREDEQSFQDVQLLRAQCTSSSGNPRDLTCEKIRRCCIFAERHGFEWVWIDTCCIDKSSSAELSEAVNSMYAWYANAEVCYAFLDDVDDDEDPRDLPTHLYMTFTSTRSSTFPRSRWFTRGWTLQELIAPMYVVFLSCNWRTLGTKHGLADLLEEVTGVDKAVLRHQLSLDHVSIARRMSWAAQRQTTRIEDNAYSLMGLFGVHMPTIYGEGAHAFVRLQQEIIKQSSDQSIFAWGRIHGFATACQTGLALSNSHGAQAETQVLLAPSPSAFAESANITPLAMEEFAAKVQNMQSRYKVPEFNPTSYGMRTTLPLVSLRRSTAAVLACQDEHGSLVLLFLRQHIRDTNTCVVGQYVHQKLEYYRAAFLPPVHNYLLDRAKSAELYIHLWNWSTARRTEIIPFPGMHGSRRMHRPHVFFFPRWVITRLRRYGFVLDRPYEDGLSVELEPCYGGDASSMITFINRMTGASFSIVLGLGGSSLKDQSAFIKHPWVAVNFDHVPGQRRRFSAGLGSRREFATPGPKLEQCPEAHPHSGSLMFGNSARRIRIEVMKWEDFHPAQMNDSVVHVLDIRLIGSSYVRVYRFR